MIDGGKYVLDRSRFHSQENNGIELLVPGLEYCGPTADTNCVASLLDEYVLPVGGWPDPQPEDIQTLAYISPGNWPEFNKIRPLNFDKIPPNRVPQYTPYAVMLLYPQLDVQFMWFNEIGKNAWEYMIENIKTSTFKICEPGHYVCIHGYDTDQKVLLKKDSWISRFSDRDGFNKPFTYDTFRVCEPFLIEFRRKI